MDERIARTRRAMELFNEHAPALLAGAPVPQEMKEHLSEDVVIVPLRATLEGTEFRGPTAYDEFWAANREVWAELSVDVREMRPEGAGVLTRAVLHGTGRAGGVAIDIPVAFATFGDDANHLTRLETHVSEEAAIASLQRRGRIDRLERARLYFVCEGRPGGLSPEPLLEAALRGGADIVQLRDKGLGDDELLEAAAIFREAADAHGALFILNDRPDLAARGGADGVHVGQDDMPVAEARRGAGGAILVGLSTHSRRDITAAGEAVGEARPDQISVGPVWETPTKQGRAATGLALIEYAAANAELPWFAIGGIDTTNVDEVAAAGARRIVVVRAIRDAADPAGAARELRAALS